MAKTFKFGENGKWATKTGSSLAYNDQNDNFKPMPFSVTRDSIATRVNKQGLIEVVGNDKLRIDYTDSTKGVALLEPARTNIITYSEFDSASPSNWQTGFGTGTFSYDLVSYKSRPALKQRQQTDGRSYKAQNVTVSTSTTYTFSFYIDKENSLNMNDNDIVCAVISSDDIGFSSRNYGDADENNRINFTFTTNTDTSIQIRIGLGASGNQAGDKTLIFSMPQLEAGSYATSYIPTSGATSQRQADVANGAGNSEVFNDSEGVLYANISSLESDDNYISLSDGSTSNRLIFGYDNNQFRVYKNGTNVFSTTSTPYNVRSLFNKIALKYSNNQGTVIYANGFLIDTGSDNLTTSGLNEVAFDSGTGVQQFYGKTKEIGVYDAVLTDAELEAITSYTSFTNMANELNLTIK